MGRVAVALKTTMNARFPPESAPPPAGGSRPAPHPGLIVIAVVAAGIAWAGPASIAGHFREVAPDGRLTGFAELIWSAGVALPMGALPALLVAMSWQAGPDRPRLQGLLIMAAMLAAGAAVMAVLMAAADMMTAYGMPAA